VRLAAAVLSAAGLWAQAPADLPWRAVDADPGIPVTGVPSTGPLKVHLAADGTLHVFDGKGVRILRMGLTGRPVKVWRDGGHGVVRLHEPMAFPEMTPLRRGLGVLPLDLADVRPGLEGLLWVLDDGERILTLLHPATRQVVRLRLPEGEDPDLRFLPDRLEVHAGGGRAWALPWVALLPQFLQLGRPAPGPPPGTALDPYPR